MITASIRITVIKWILLSFNQFSRRNLINAFLGNNFFLENMGIKILSQLSDLAFNQIAKRNKPAAHITVKRAITKSDFSFIGVTSKNSAYFLSFRGQYFHSGSSLNILMNQSFFFDSGLIANRINNVFNRTSFEPRLQV